MSSRETLVEAPAKSESVSTARSWMQLRNSRPIILWAMLAIAVLLNCTIVVATLNDHFDTQEHSWVATHHLLMARNFARFGIIHLHGVPVQNNPPDGLERDVYVHWPPLYPMLLAEVFRIFGESERVARFTVLVIAVVTALGIFQLAKWCCGMRAGILAAAWLSFPVVYTFGIFIMPLNLGNLFLVFAILCFGKSIEGDSRGSIWTITGVTSFALAALSSWEPMLAAAGLLIAAWAYSERRTVRLSILYASVGAAAQLLVLCIYLLSSPVQRAQVWQTLLYRLGFAHRLPTSTPLHGLAAQWWYEYRGQSTFPDFCKTLLQYSVREFGIFGLAACLSAATILLFLKRSSEFRRPFLVFAGVFSPGVLWYLGMRNHAYQHTYEMLAFAPALAMLLGAGYIRLESFLNSRNWPSAVIGLQAMLAIGILTPLAANTSIQIRPHLRIGWHSLYAAMIERTTQPEAVILSPDASMVPVYYSHRHVIQYVTTDAHVEEVLSRVHTIFPGVPVYLALPPGTDSWFPKTMQKYRARQYGDYLILVDLSARSS